MFEYSNSKIYSEAAYLQKTLKAADTQAYISLFVKNFFVALKHYIQPVILFFVVVFNLKPFACFIPVYTTVS